MQIVRTVAEVRAARRALGRIGFVPTMGALHDGHLSLVTFAGQQCDSVAVSIFVNPTQFGPGEDLARYPRPIDADLARLAAANVAMVFLPTPEEMYPDGFATSIQVGRIADRLEGAMRPGHFAGVATVVAKLFAIVGPERAFFGQKDVQQTRVIMRMVQDLNLPVEIVVGPTVREPDGLALSSRNIYLDAAQRAQAPRLAQGLRAAQAAFARGERDASILRGLVEAAVRETDGVIEYLSVADPDTFEEIDWVGQTGAVLSAAFRLGSTRLLDNVML